MILNSFLVLSEIGNANFCVDREGGGGGVGKDCFILSET